MLAWRKLPSQTLFAVNTIGLILMLSIYSPISFADGIYIRSAESFLDEKIYRLNAELDYHLSDEVVSALHNGVTLHFVLEIEVNRNRTYWWNELIASLQQKYQLSYHALSNRYLLTNENSGAKYSFIDLSSAISLLGNVTQLPILDKNVLDKTERYTCRIRASLATDELPTPIRLLAYFTPGWRHYSEWYVWPIKQ